MPEPDNLENWQTLAELVAKERNPAKFADLLEKLLDALDREMSKSSLRSRQPNQSIHREPRA
jgi:hypothetical protein